MLYLVATLLILYELSLTTIPSRYAKAAAADATSASSSSSLKGTEMDVNSFTHINKPSMTTAKFHRLPRHTVQGLQQQQKYSQLKELQQKLEDPSSVENAKIKRSFSTSNNWPSSAFNGLAGFKDSSQLHSIRNSNNDAAQQPTIHQYQQYTEAKPIYEEQQENDYALGSSGSGGSGPWHNQHSTTSVANVPALHSAIYNLQTAGTHNGALSTSSGSNSGSNGGSDGFLPSWNFGKLSTSFIASQPASTPYATTTTATSSDINDKISEGNFLHHYDSASAFNEYTPQQEYLSYQQQLQQQQQQQQHQLLQKHENFYNSVEHTEGDTSSSYGDEHEHDNNGHFSNYQQHEYEQQQQEKQPDVINYVPYPVVKKQHVPVREPVQIPVSHAVIIPVSKPVPIHIPVTQNVQVPIQQDLKIPVERVVPYPVEKHVPVPVEKRVPYPIVKYVPIKIPRPFPVKVPVFKTVLHKVKGWW